jgi:hypothetical protein
MRRRPNKPVKVKMKAPTGATTAERVPSTIQPTVLKWRGGARIGLPIEDGCVFVVSDQHYAPKEGPSPAHLASLVLAKKLKPFAIINNGDTIDGASISRWPVGSFTELEGRPTVAAELGVAATRLADYEALKYVKYRVWNLGNHDARYETRLADKVPEYSGVAGFTLKEHFTGWMPAWRTDLVQDDQVAAIIKHRFKGGMHAGTMAPMDTPTATHYTEDNVVNWQPGFAVLHFRGGEFVGPELIHCLDFDRVLFRGDVLKVG